jgi:hypothetical protein
MMLHAPVITCKSHQHDPSCLHDAGQALQLLEEGLNGHINHLFLSINKSINQSINQLIKQSVSQSISQFINPSMGLSRGVMRQNMGRVSKCT